MINCPVCGGAGRRLTPLRRSRTCPYCGHDVGEKHRTIGEDVSKNSMTIELFLDENDKPWRIQHSITKPLDDLDVLAAIDDSENAVKIKRLRMVKYISMGLSILPVLALFYSLQAPAEDRMFNPIVLVLSSLSLLVLSNWCEIAACRIGHKHAYLTLGSRTEQESSLTEERGQTGLGIGGAGGSRTPVRKHSAVGTTCLVSLLALAASTQKEHRVEQRTHYLFSDPV